MILRKMEMEKNNRREALSAIILSSYTVYLVGSEPTACTFEHTTIYYRMQFIESCVDLQHRAFISADSATPCTICTSISSAPAYPCTVSYSSLWILQFPASHIHFVGFSSFLHDIMHIPHLLAKKLYHHPVPNSFPLPDAISCPSSA